MLTDEQLKHFAEHGWVMEPDVFGADQIDACRQAMDRHADGHPRDTLTETEIEKVVQCILNYETTFRDTLMDQRILDAHRQLTGTEIRHLTNWMIIRHPHPDRKEKRDALMQPETLGWHRDLRPKWGMYAHDSEPERINSLFNNSTVLLTDIGKDDGGTVALDGSHKAEGTWQEVIETCAPRQIEGSAGSVIHFSECLMHTGVPILSEKSRYVMFVSYGPPWFKTWYKSEIPEEILESIQDEERRNILAGWDRLGYHGQRPVI